MNQYVIDNAQIWTGDGAAFDGHIVVEGGIITAVGTGRAESSLPRVDLNGLALSPGLIDLMVLGGFDQSILRDDPRDLAREYLRLGVTSCQLCIGTLPWDSMLQVAANTRRARDEGDEYNAAKVLGLYLEGPFQQPDLTGASQKEYSLPPTPENVQRILDEMGDAVTMVNVAPGWENDTDAIRVLRDAGKVVSMAHSNATAERVFFCLEAGTSVLGHIWNNNGGLTGDSGVQQPTIEQVALTDERVKFIHIICDGSHVHPVLVRMTLRCRGIEAMCLVTDAVSRAGCPDGEFFWDDGRRFVKKDGVGRTDRGTLCGGALLLPDMLRNFVKFTGLEPQQAIRAATFNPAASLGLDHEIGLIAPGRRADFAAWNDKLQLQRVWKSGREVENVSELAEITL